MFPCKFLFWSARKLLWCHFQLLNRQTTLHYSYVPAQTQILGHPRLNIIAILSYMECSTCMCKSTIITHLCVKSLVPRLFFIRAMGEPENEAKCKSHTTSVEACVPFITLPVQEPACARERDFV